MQFAICFFLALSVGIHGHRQESHTGSLAREPVSRNIPDASSTEQYLLISEATDPSSTEQYLLNSEATDPSSTEQYLLNSEATDPSSTWTGSKKYPVTPGPCIAFIYKPESYSSFRAGFKVLAKHDNYTKLVFDYLNRPTYFRGVIDTIFYSVDRSREEMVDNLCPPVDEISTGNDYSEVDDEDRIKNILDELMQVNYEEFKPKAKYSADQIVINDVNYNVKEGWIRLQKIKEDLYSGTVNLITKTPDEPMDVTFEEEYSSVRNVESDNNATPTVTTFIPVEILGETTTTNPENVYDETEHFTKDWSETRFPPITVAHTKVDKSKRETYDLPVSEILERKPKLDKSDQAEYKAAVALQAVEGALVLAEAIARETAQLVTRITMEALRHSVTNKSLKLDSNTQATNPEKH